MFVAGRGILLPGLGRHHRCLYAGWKVSFSYFPLSHSELHTSQGSLSGAIKGARVRLQGDEELGRSAKDVKVLEWIPYTAG